VAAEEIAAAEGTAAVVDVREVAEGTAAVVDVKEVAEVTAEEEDVRNEPIS
jgi:hypothetical protein